MTPSRRSRSTADSAGALKFATDSAFQLELRRRVDEYFRVTGRRQRDCWQMYLKTAILLAGSGRLVPAAGVRGSCVVAERCRWPSCSGWSRPASASTFSTTAGHHAYSDHPWINKLMAMTLDLIGGSSYVWHWKHDVIHHTYVNVTGHDTDIDLGFLGRVTPHQPRLAFHRWQHLYLWPLYGLLAIKWQLVDDFRRLIAGRIGSYRVRRPTGEIWFSSWPARRSSSPGRSGSRCCSTPCTWSSSLRGRRAGARDRPDRRVPGGPLRRRGGVPAARRGHGAHRTRLGHPSGGDDRGLRPTEPGGRPGSSAA